MSPAPSSATADWLRQRDDDALRELLRGRPDLALPAPTSLEALARRLDTPASIWRALETIDRFTVQILQALVVLGADHAPVTPAAVSSFLGRAAPRAAVDAALRSLETLALARGGKTLRVPRAVSAALGPYPAGLGTATGLDPASVAERLADCPAPGKALLEKLSKDSPVGSTSPDAPVAPVIADLIARGLLVRRDSGTVELPREVGLALRGKHPVGQIELTAPVFTPVTHTPQRIDETAAGQALEALRTWRRLLELLAEQPATVLKAGGLGVRDLRRIARHLELTEPAAALHLELLAAAGLIAPGDPRGTRGLNEWLPTALVDDWSAAEDALAWAQIALVWLDLRRDPARTGRRDLQDRPMNVLSAELTWLRGPADRRWVLSGPAALEPGNGIRTADLVALLGWRAPLRGADRREAVVTQIIGEATDLGVVAFGALTSSGRVLLAEGEVEDIAAALAPALPPATETFLIQADLTVMAAGRLVPEVAARLAAAADLESAGQASVYRVTPESLRRALDGGASTGELHELFSEHSSTPVPQSLTYLIDDVGRRHGVLRVGTAYAYLRCDDPVLIDTAIAHATAAGLLLRKLAPTVAVCLSAMEELIPVLRQAGLAPAAEDHTGAVVTLDRSARRRGTAKVTHQRWREPAVPEEEQLDVLIARMREAELAAPPVGQSPTEALNLLREAATVRSSVWIEYVNAEGASTRRLIEPLAVSGGAVSAFDRLSRQMRTFALHRISGIAPAAE